MVQRMAAHHGMAATVGRARALALGWSRWRAHAHAAGRVGAARASHALLALGELRRSRLQKWRLAALAAAFNVRRSTFAAQVGELQQTASGWRRWIATWRRDRHRWLHRHRAWRHRVRRVWDIWMLAMAVGSIHWTPSPVRHSGPDLV